MPVSGRPPSSRETSIRISVLGTAVVAAALSPLAVVTTAAADTSHSAELTSIGLTHDQKLVTFATNAPTKAHALGHVHGLSKDSKLVGIDFRVQNGKLYGVGDKGGIYTLGTGDAKAVKVSQLTVALEGEYFGVDFNPPANRLRVISDTGQNLRHNIDDPAAPRTTTTDGTLTNPAMPPSTEAPTAKGVTGAAYTNNDLDKDTATTLFDIDTTNDRVSLQSPANAGNLAPTGSLGVKAGPSAGFDIHHDPHSGANHAFAALHVDGHARLYSVDLLTGSATHKGAFPANLQVTDLALQLDEQRPQGAMHTGGGALAATHNTPLAPSTAVGGALLLLGGLGAGARYIARRKVGATTTA